MSTISRRVLVVVIVSLFLGLAAMLMSLEAYSLAQSTQAAPVRTSTPVSLRKKFNWNMAEVVDVQGNLYAYLGSEGTYLHLAKWQSDWMELSYYCSYLPQNVTLSPYILQVTSFNNNYLAATFFEG